MWRAVTNRTDEFWQDGNINNNSQKAVAEKSWVSFAEPHNNGSRPVTDVPNANTPPQKTSGIIPGLIAAALFIAFLLALYAMLWKCMVSRPTRRMRRQQQQQRRASAHVKPERAC